MCINDKDMFERNMPKQAQQRQDPLREARRILLEQEAEALIDRQAVTDLHTAHREQLDSPSAALLKAETLDEIDAYAAAHMPSRHNGNTRPQSSDGRLSEGV